MSWLPISGPPGMREQLIASMPALYSGYVASPWQVWPAVPIQRVLQPTPQDGRYVPSSSTSALTTMQPYPGGLMGLLGGEATTPDSTKNALTRAARGVLSQAEGLTGAPETVIENARVSIEAARTQLMAVSRWSDSSVRPVALGGWDSWQACMDNVNRAQRIVLALKGRGRGSIRADGSVIQDSVASAYASGFAEGAGEGLDNLKKGLPVMGVSAGALAAAAGAVWLLSKRR